MGMTLLSVIISSSKLKLSSSKESYYGLLGVEERPKAPLEEIRVIVGRNTMTGSSKKARKTYLRMVQNV